MKLSEIKNADPELFIQVVQRLLAKGEKVWLRFMDEKMETVPVAEIDPQELDLFVNIDYEGEEQWHDLNPNKEWTVSKEKIGWVIHAVS